MAETKRITTKELYDQMLNLSSKFSNEILKLNISIDKRFSELNISIDERFSELRKQVRGLENEYLTLEYELKKTKVRAAYGSRSRFDDSSLRSLGNSATEPDRVPLLEEEMYKR